MMNQPLQGVKVVDLTNYLSGPACGRTLHDWGCDVIKIESTYGDITRHVTGSRDINQISFDEENYGKRVVSVDLKKPEGLRLLKDLTARADVFLTSYRAKALKGMGLDYETLHRENPKLIWAHLCGFGEQGPMKDEPGFDKTAYWCTSGLLSSFTYPDAVLNRPPGGFGDLNTGMMLAGGIAAALYRRCQTGEGEKVSLSLYGKAIWDMGYIFWDMLNGNEYPRKRTGADYPMMNTFRCSDGKWLYMSVMDHDRTYAKVMRTLGREDLAEDERFSTMEHAFAHLDELYDELDPTFASRPRDEWVRILKAQDIAAEPVREVKDLLDDPQSQSNEYIIERTLRDGRTRRKMVTTPVRFGDDKAAPYSPGRPVGQDTAAVMKELGYDDETIAAYERSGIVRTK